MEGRNAQRPGLGWRELSRPEAMAKHPDLRGFKIIRTPKGEPTTRNVHAPNLASQAEGTVYELMTPDNEIQAPLVYGAVFETIRNPGEGVVLNGYNLGVLAASLICSILPSLTTSIIRIIRNYGHNVISVKVPSEFVATGAPEPEIFGNYQDCLVVFGQVVLLLFKNISQKNYDRYFAARSRGLRARAALVQVEAGASIAFEIDKAAAIRDFLGNIPALRKLVLNKVLLLAATGEEGPLVPVCEYLCEMLAWTDMSPITFINDTLVACDSPVLTHRSVRHETLNLYEAYKLIAVAPYPQFFRILAPQQDQNALLRTNFPTLIAVAQRLRGAQSPTLNQFVCSNQVVDEALIENLIALHLNYLESGARGEIGHVLKFFSGNLKEEQVTAPENSQW